MSSDSTTGAADARDLPSSPRPSARLLSVLGVLVLGIAVGGYAWKGSPGLKPVPASAAQSDAAPDAEEQAARQQIEGMVEQLAQRLQKQPDDATGWQMLGRSYMVLGRIDNALPAYQKALALRGKDAAILADYAAALAAKSNGQPSAEADALVARALAADPKQLKALALAGTFAFERADYAGAVKHWEAMAQSLPADSPDMPRLQASLAEARRRGGIAAAPGASTTVAAAGAASPGAATANADAKANAKADPKASLTGTVTLAPALAAKASPTDTVFVFARAAQGPRMPLAVVRAQVKDLPLAYKLDDSMAMAPSARISGAAQVIVGARISKSGNAVAQPGDLTGESAPVAPGTNGIAITIDRAVGS